MTKLLAVVVASTAGAAGVAAGTASPAPTPTPTPPVDPHHMPLYRMHDFANATGARCLDGSPGAFYFRPATDAAHAHDWLLHFKGAGWCYDAEDCRGRAATAFGSSWRMENVTAGWSSGVLNPEDDVFGGFNKVVLEYCDGVSFTGDRDEPLVLGGDDGDPRHHQQQQQQQQQQKLYFRGRRIRDAIFDTLERDHGLGAARDVLLTGCSSGALAAYIHADWVGERLVRAVKPPRVLRRFK